MPVENKPLNSEMPSPAGKLPDREDTADASSATFFDKFGEELDSVLDIGQWRTEFDPFKEYERVCAEVKESVQCESECQRRTRERIFPLLATARDAPSCAGVYQASDDILRAVHRGLLFNGGVECCDGTVEVHDTLPLTIYQIGVSLVSYCGDAGTWNQRLFRRDLRQQLNDPVNETEKLLQLLESRSQRSALNHGTPGDSLGELARKAVLDYAERAVLLKQTDKVWRMGHGNPITYELVTGGGMWEMMKASTNLLRELIEGHRKFVFVASEPRDRLRLTIGQALLPKEYAIICSLDTILRGWFHQYRFKVGAKQVRWDDELIPTTEWIPRFLDQVASQVVVGVYRASPLAPAQMFYAHNDCAHLAAHIAIADSMLQVERGFPLLIDLAHHVCKTVFGGSLDYLTETAYNAAGAPYRYLSERASRRD